MSEYIDIGHCQDYECFVALHSYLAIGIQYDDLTGIITCPKSRWELFSLAEQDRLQNTMESFVVGWEAKQIK